MIGYVEKDKKHVNKSDYGTVQAINIRCILPLSNP